MKIFGRVFLGLLIVGSVSCAFLNEYWSPSDVLAELNNSDSIPPGLVISYPYGKGQSIPTTYTIYGTARDNESGIRSVTLSVDGDEKTNCVYNAEDYTWSAEVAVTRLGYHTNIVTAIDLLGNRSDTETNIVNCIPQTVYVSSSFGNDTNTGFFPDQPVLTVSYGITLAVSNQLADVYLESGEYTPGNGLLSVPMTNNDWSTFISLIGNTNLNLIGGWNSGFTSIEGLSRLDAQGKPGKLIAAHSCQELNIRNFWLTGAVLTNEPISGGGGIEVDYSERVLLSNLIISNNEVYLSHGVYSDGGGGLMLYFSEDVRFYGTVVDNFDENEGGGIYIKNGLSVELNGLVARNETFHTGGGIFFRDTFSSVVNTDVVSNRAGEDGGGIVTHYSGSITFNGKILDNICSATNSYGGGMSFNTCMFMDIFGDISRNSSSNQAGGIHVISGQVFNIENNIMSNYAAGHGCAMSISNTPYLRMNACLVDYNISGSSGGDMSNASVIAIDDLSGILFLENNRIGLSNTMPLLNLGSSFHIYDSLYVRGTFNDWSASNAMSNISPNQWQIDLTNLNATNEFKFEVGGREDSWDENWGDDNGDGIAEFNGANISVGVDGNVRITFNELTRQYTITTN